jgi:hypothetical protein
MLLDSATPLSLICCDCAITPPGVSISPETENLDNEHMTLSWKPAENETRFVGEMTADTVGFSVVISALEMNFLEGRKATWTLTNGKETRTSE